MKQKMTIGIIIALLMITSTLTITTTADDPVEPGVEIIKEVQHGCSGWQNEISASVGDSVQFKIRVYYHEPVDEEDFWIRQIEITDSLPSGLKYETTTLFITPEGSVENLTNIENTTLTWHLGSEKLHDFDETGEYVEIRFTAEVIDYGENINTVHIDAVECCCGALSDDDSVTINVCGIEFNKKVWDPYTQMWVEDLPYVLMSQPVYFGITLTYHGPHMMKCLTIWDIIPEECLEYYYTVGIQIGLNEIHPGDDGYPEIFTGGDTIEICDQDYIVPDDSVVWDWRNTLFGLSDGETVSIAFYTNVTQYCDCTVSNSASALLWGCMHCDPCNHFFGCDTANITCNPQPTNLQKSVWDEDHWAEETTAVVGETVRFKLELTYYGSTNLSDIKIIDHLPECLSYANDATILESNVSDDLGTVWWNLTDVLFDAGSISIEYNALVVEAGECGICENVATVTAQECSGPIFADEDSASVIPEENSAPTLPLLEKAITGEVDETLSFNVKSHDVEGNMVYYFVDWGDSTNSGWIGPYTEGIWTEITNSWDTAGTYTVKAKAKDEFGQESVDWGNSIAVTITGGTEPPQGENITISGVSGGFRKVNAVIENSADEIINVNWSITIEGRLLSRKNVQTPGNDTINPGESLTVQCQPKFIGFGRVVITVVADASEYGTDTGEYSGFQLGPFILFIRPV